MKKREVVKAFLGGIASGLAGYSASRILTCSCPKTGDWRKDMALKAGCGLIGGMVAGKVEEDICRQVDDCAETIDEVRKMIDERKAAMVEKQEDKVLNRFKKVEYTEVEPDPAKVNSSMMPCTKLESGGYSVKMAYSASDMARDVAEELERRGGDTDGDA